MSEHPHGSRQRYEAGCSCDGCRLMMVLHSKHETQRQRREQRERRQYVSSMPCALIVRELRRQGHTYRELSELTHVDVAVLQRLHEGVPLMISRAMHVAVGSLARLLPTEVSA